MEENENSKGRYKTYSTEYKISNLLSSIKKLYIL